MGLARESVVISAPPAFAGDGSQPCSAREAEAIALVLRSTEARRPAAASSAEELLVRLCGSAEATASVLGARRAGGSTASPCSEHLVRLSRKSQEREGSCADQSDIEAHWLEGATSPKANPPKPTAAQSISGDKAAENDSQKYGEGVSRFHSLTHLSERTRTYFPKSSGFPTPKGCGRSRTSTNDSEQPISRRKSVWSISRRAQSGRFHRTQKKAEH